MKEKTHRVNACGSSRHTMTAYTNVLLHGTVALIRLRISTPESLFNSSFISILVSADLITVLPSHHLLPKNPVIKIRLSKSLIYPTVKHFFKKESKICVYIRLFDTLKYHHQPQEPFDLARVCTIEKCSSSPGNLHKVSY